MTDFFAVEDMNNIRTILLHHLGHPTPIPGVGVVGLMAQEYFDRLEEDLLRYCTRLRCQPDTAKHTEGEHSVPAHELIRKHRI